MKKYLKRSILVLSLALLATGCVARQQVRYHDAALELKASARSLVAVAAHDNRSYVKNGEKEKNYAGNFRGGFGNPFNVTTESGRPLADDMASVICAAFVKKGFRCKEVPVEPNQDKGQISSKLVATDADKLLLLTIDEWYPTTFQNTILSYNLDLNVMNRNGGTLVEKKVKGEEDLGGSFFNPPAHAKEAVPQAYKRKLEELLNDAAVTDSLR